MANERSKTITGFDYFEATVDFASTAAEATSAAVTVQLPSKFRVDRPIICGLKVNQAAMNDNACWIVPSFSSSIINGVTTVTASLKFANNNVAAGAAIDPGAKTFWFIQF